MRQLAWMSVLLSGCGWLFEVPENQIPRHEQTGDANTRANQVESSGLTIDDERRPMMKELNMVGNGSEDPVGGEVGTATPASKPVDDWQPVSIPKDVAPSSFKFESAGGTKIYNGSSSAKLPPPPPEWAHLTPQQWEKLRQRM